MANVDVLPELKEILGAMIFATNRPLPAKEMRQCLAEVAEATGGETAVFGKVKEADVVAAMESLKEEVAKAHAGFEIVEVAGGYRFQSVPRCGKWLRQLLNVGRPSRLSQPALETLAIIAYRQPLSRAEIESIRGVTVDHVMKTLLEMQMIRIAGRSELPGRPFLYGTTQTFLEHFGLKDLKDLAGIDPALFKVRGEGRGVKQERPEAPADPASADAAASAAERPKDESAATSPEEVTMRQGRETNDADDGDGDAVPGGDAEDREREADSRRAGDEAEPEDETDEDDDEDDEFDDDEDDDEDDESDDDR